MPKPPADQSAQSTKKRPSKASKASQTAKKSSSKAPRSRPAPETGSTGDSLTLTELLSSSTARLPKRDDEDIERYLAQLFNDYVEGVARLSMKGTGARAVRNEIGTIQGLSQGILSTLDQYLSGHTFNAFQKFSASRVSAKPAMRGHFKTGHSRPGTLNVVPIAALCCKSHF